MIVPPNNPQSPPVPEDVGTAKQLWFAVAGLGVVYTGASVAAMAGQRGELSKQFLDEMHKTDPNIPASTVDLLVTAALVLTVIIGVLLAGVTAAVAHQLGRGKSWARTVLTVVAVWLGIGAVATMFSFTGDTGVAVMVSGGTSIVQGVLAVGAAYLCFRPDSIGYFQKNRR
ncbi:hypothetical protein [Nocardia caishijiensis]|uniref:Integral membrane protein n=1 Tax=Nocardia caishijiensis TaxID=184756 RepID=A0ABQ6YT18_9NOCA|nr:hypothetical protein [Nocardia caishijiensis]KAF0848940.1 hypothetical protein FNL39_101375 [Nocardia caishijiensis]